MVAEIWPLLSCWATSDMGFQAADLGTLVLQGVLNFLARLPAQLGHNLIGIVLEWEVGGDRLRIATQQANCSPVIGSGSCLLCVIVAH